MVWDWPYPSLTAFELADFLNDAYILPSERNSTKTICEFQVRELLLNCLSSYNPVFDALQGQQQHRYI
jgi:hypothetical protein